MIVFSDLDGTLLDHATYDASPARPALAALAAREVPVILASSKTAPEMRRIQQSLGLAHWPAIIENGAGILDAHADPDPAEYIRLRGALDSLPGDMRGRFKGFGDVDADQVVAWTGLDHESAKLAQTRAFTEPGIFTGDDIARRAFLETLGAAGIVARAGGRFLTLSFGRTKADALRYIAGKMGRTPVIALGDAPNDHDMLLAADLAVIIRNDHGPDPGDIPNAIRTSLPGPAGWNAAIEKILTAEGS